MDGSPLKGCEVKRGVKETLEVVGPRERFGDAMWHLAGEGWRVTRSGAFTDERLWPWVDATRFLILAERETTGA